MSEHTKGPWTFTKDGRVKGPEGNTICDARYKNMANDGPLLAAAHELLQELRVARQYVGDYGDEHGWPLAVENDMNSIDAAIAKAGSATRTAIGKDD